MRFEVMSVIVVIALATLARAAPATKPAPRTADGAVTPVPGAMDYHQRHLARAREGNIDLLFLGDSITDFWPSRAPDVWAKLTGYHPADFGVSGEHTEHLLWRIENGELDGINPKVVVVMIGTNNIGHCPDEEPEWAAAGIEKVVKSVREKLPQSKVLLLGIFPRDKKDSDLRRKVEAINRIISKLDDGKNIRYLDIGAKFLGANGEIPMKIMPDLLHPNGDGYEIWYQAMIPTLAEMMERPIPNIGRTDPYSPRTAADSVTPAIRWSQRHDQFVARARQGNIGLLFLGDSITDNWPTLGKDSWDKLAPFNVVNFGIGGDRTEHVLWRVENGELDGIHPRVVVLMIGTNNIGDGNHPDEKPEWTAAGVSKIVATIRGKLPESKILLLAIFPRNTRESELSRKATEVNRIISKLDDGGAVHYLDIGKSFLDSNGEIPKEIMPDQLHPNARGYEIWYEAMLPTLKRLMGTDRTK